MPDQVYVGVDLAKEFHQVMAVDQDHQVLAPTFRIGRGQGGVQEMIDRLRFLVRQESDLVFTIEATSDYWWELAWELDNRGCVVYLAHPKKAHDLRKFYALHTKTDVTDAEALARMPLVDTSLKSLWRPRVDSHGTSCGSTHGFQPRSVACLFVWNDFSISSIAASPGDASRQRFWA